MRLTIVNGFFLPVPPVSGGSTEKSWYHLGQEFAARGHAVTNISRQWRGFSDDEEQNGVRYRRLRGNDHNRELWLNLVDDLVWSWRVYRNLPPADIIIVNAVALPMWLGRFRPKAGKVVVMTGRMPKGQYRRYHHLARVLAPSSFVRDKIVAENPRLAPVIRVTGYPINWRSLSLDGLTQHPQLPHIDASEITLGFVGRIHEEKGLLLLADALRLVSQAPDLPKWRLMLCGPADIARGGSGGAFRGKLSNTLSAFLHSDRFNIIDPQFNERVLAGLYRRINIFCYPSLAEQGETFGVAVAEAMAAGAVPVVSKLECFTDFVRHDANGLVFDHRAPDAPAQLAAALERLIRDAALRQRLADAARQDSRRYDYGVFAEALLADFAELTRR
ncbi:MAG: glycosyltransferase family 4 protein [Opitutae bacterium]|nr:glycosyltransferase family 4 protein [Opitutae bacterium]